MHSSFLKPYLIEQSITIFLLILIAMFTWSPCGTNYWGIIWQEISAALVMRALSWGFWLVWKDVCRVQLFLGSSIIKSLFLRNMGFVIKTKCEGVLLSLKGAFCMKGEGMKDLKSYSLGRKRELGYTCIWVRIPMHTEARYCKTLSISPLMWSH